MNSRQLRLFAASVVIAGCASNANLLKLEREQREMRALLADTQVSTDNLRRQIDELRVTVQEGRRARPGPSPDLDKRLSQLEARLKMLEAAQTTAALPPPAGLPPESRPIDLSVRGTDAASLAVRAEAPQLARVGDPYRAGMEFFRQGEWEKAIAKFREFVQSDPRSDLADNAQYWIGEAYYNQRDYNRAIIELNEVLLKYPQGDRVPGALLALATAFADSGDKIDARLILEKLISDHPGSEEAKIGRQKLQALTG